MRNKLSKLQFSITVALVVALVLSVTAAFALVSINNGTFDMDVSGWTATTGTINWNADDHTGNMGGSAEVTDGEAVQCVDFSMTSGTPTNFTFDGWGKVPMGSGANQQRITLDFTSDGNLCSTPVASGHFALFSPGDNNWDELSQPLTPIPAGANSVKVSLVAGGISPANVLYDDLTIGIFGPTAITLSSMDARSSTGSLLIIALAALLLSGGGLLVLRRRRLS